MNENLYETENRERRERWALHDKLELREKWLRRIDRVFLGSALVQALAAGIFWMQPGRDGILIAMVITAITGATFNYLANKAKEKRRNL